MKRFGIWSINIIFAFLIFCPMKLSFNKKKDGEISKPSTASVPGVLFMFLLFLMASTVMHETALNVEQAEGGVQGPEYRLKRHQDAAFVYVGPSDVAIDRRYRRGGYTLLFNDSYAAVDQIDEFVKTEKKFSALRGNTNMAFRVRSDGSVDKETEYVVKELLDKAIAADTAHYKLK